MDGGVGVITVVSLVTVFFTWRETLCVFGRWSREEEEGGAAANLSGANSAAVWVAMCQSQVLLRCHTGNVCMCQRRKER